MYSNAVPECAQKPAISVADTVEAHSISRTVYPLNSIIYTNCPLNHQNSNNTYLISVTDSHLPATELCQNKIHCCLGGNVYHGGPTVSRRTAACPILWVSERCTVQVLDFHMPCFRISRAFFLPPQPPFAPPASPIASQHALVAAVAPSHFFPVAPSPRRLVAPSPCSVRSIVRTSKHCFGSPVEANLELLTSIFFTFSL